MIFNKSKEMSPAEKKAKLTALKEVDKLASDEIKKGLSGAKKVSVIADSEKGLKKGLEMAEKIVGQRDSEDSELSDKMEDAQERYEDQQDESSPMDIDEIEEEIKRLMELKAKLSEE